MWVKFIQNVGVNFFFLSKKCLYSIFIELFYSPGATCENSIHHFRTSVIIIDNSTSNNDFVTDHPGAPMISVVYPLQCSVANVE